jgi:FtsP/CotA-like multicopper oxidase with cupredoxin domain
VTPTAKRTIYFSELSLDPSDPDAAVIFFITVDGQPPVAFDPNNPPAIVTTEGAVEDWTIENRADENHAFHIHQIHFLLMAQSGVAVTNPQYLDTVNIPYWTGTGPYPSVTVRMDFRGAVVGDFVYHCHILEHEDGGMMATIRVNPAPPRPVRR